MGRWMRAAVALVAMVALAGVVAGRASAAGGAGAGTLGGGHYDHVVVVMEENHGFSDVIGNPAAPNFNRLADQYGLATDYYGISHPSEPNYVALLGGSTDGVASDNPYYVNRVNQPSLISQLDGAHLPWKAYLQGLPHPGYQGICYPGYCNGTPDKDPLYVSKHNPVTNFTADWNAQDWSRQVPADQLSTDLQRGKLPAFSLLVPDECHDQHGDPPYCVDSGSVDNGNPSTADPQDQRLVATGDQYLGATVAQITGSRQWQQGNNAVVITYDEGDDNAGCCNANPGGGKVATVVVTNHGPRHVQDPTPYNHYSLLKSVQQDLNLGCLANTCSSSVSTMGPLFTLTGAPPTPYSPVTPPAYPTPTPTEPEPVSSNPGGQSSGGWTTQTTPQVGATDNSYGAVSAAGPDDVFAVGNRLPDTPGSNPDATLSLAAHGSPAHLAYTPTPNAGTNFTTLFGVAATGGGQAWAVGDSLDAAYQPRSVAEHFDGSSWSLVPLPSTGGPGAAGDMLFAAAAAGPSNVWAVGQQQAGDGRWSPLVEHYDGTRWGVLPAFQPGSSGDSLYAVTVAPDGTVWAAGQQSAPGGDEPLLERYDGRRWAAVQVAEHACGSGLLDGITATPAGQVVAVGQTDSAADGAVPMIATVDGHGRASCQTTTAGAPAGTGSSSGPSEFANLNGVAVDRNGTVWASGTVFDPSGTYDGAPGGVQQTMVLEGAPGGAFTRVPAPSPGTADRILGGMTTAGDQLVSVGYSEQPSGRVPLVETHPAG